MQTRSHSKKETNIKEKEKDTPNLTDSQKRVLKQNVSSSKKSGKQSNSHVKEKNNVLEINQPVRKSSVRSSKKEESSPAKQDLENEGSTKENNPNSSESQNSNDKQPNLHNKTEDIKIKLGSFVQKYDNVEEYLAGFDEKIRLGSGHYSEVFKLQKKDGETVRAMKIINKKKIPFNEKESFLREIQILKRLDHPNVLKLYEFLEDESSYYLITELCEGKELFDIIQENCDSLTEADVASIIQQILQSLAYAHSNKIMHRDIKPENIMVSKDSKNVYSLKVVDWGIGSDFDSNDATLNMKCGTPYYAAPEVIKKKYNEKCDIWSTGVILYTLLVQEIPFNGDSTTDIILNVLKGKYTIEGGEWQKVSDDAKDLVKKMLCYDYEKRISAEEALRHPWFKQVLLHKVSKQAIKVNLTKLKLFQAKSQLQKAAMSFIVSHLINDKEKEQFQCIFKQLDENGDGKLSKSEITNGYKKVWGRIISDEEVNSLFDHIDVDQSGFIDYNEFITALIDSSVFTEQEKLRQAFKLFDKDGDGFITSKEIQTVLGMGIEIEEEKWSKIVAEVDENGDGQISFEEFQAIMQSLANEEALSKKKNQRKKSNVIPQEVEE